MLEKGGDYHVKGQGQGPSVTHEQLESALSRRDQKIEALRVEHERKCDQLRSIMQHEIEALRAVVARLTDSRDPTGPSFATSSYSSHSGLAAVDDQEVVYGENPLHQRRPSSQATGPRLSMSSAPPTPLTHERLSQQYEQLLQQRERVAQAAERRQSLGSTSRPASFSSSLPGDQ